MIKKWYKQFWPWFLIGIPVSSFCAGFVIVYVAVTTEHSMVSDDYYKEGKAINVDLSKVRKARQLNLVAGIEVTGDRLQLRFKQALPPNAAALTLEFFHSTLQDRDFSLLLTQNAAGIFTATVPMELKGKWQLTLHDFEDTWRIQQDVSFPRSGEIVLEP